MMHPSEMLIEIHELRAVWHPQHYNDIRFHSIAKKLLFATSPINSGHEKLYPIYDAKDDDRIIGTQLLNWGGPHAPTNLKMYNPKEIDFDKITAVTATGHKRFASGGRVFYLFEAHLREQVADERSGFTEAERVMILDEALKTILNTPPSVLIGDYLTSDPSKVDYHAHDIHQPHEALNGQTLAHYLMHAPGSLGELLEN